MFNRTQRFHLSKRAVRGHGNPWFQGWGAGVPTRGNPQFLEMGTCSFKIGKHRLQPSPTLERRPFLEIGTCASKVGKHGLQPLGTGSFSKLEPVVPTLGSMGSNLQGPAGPRNRNPRFQPLGTRRSSKWEPVVSKFGGEGSLSRNGNAWFQGWEAWVPTGERAVPRHGSLMFQGCVSMNSNLLEPTVLRNTNTVSLRSIMQNKATILQYTLFSCWFSQQMSYSNTLSFRPTKQNQANPLYTTFFIPLQQAPVLRKHMLIWAQQAKQKRLVPRKIVFFPSLHNLGT
jgi:hypothetical protein